MMSSDDREDLAFLVQAAFNISQIPECSCCEKLFHDVWNRLFDAVEGEDL